MSSLGLSLLILIVLAIAALAGYNYWVNRAPRSQSRLDSGFSSAPQSERSQRQEPSFSVAETAEAAVSVGAETAPPAQEAPAEAVTDWGGAEHQRPSDPPAQTTAPGQDEELVKPSWVSGAGEPDQASDPGAGHDLDWRQAAQFDPTAEELEESDRAPADQEISDQLVGEIEKTLAEVESAAVEQPGADDSGSSARSVSPARAEDAEPAEAADGAPQPAVTEPEEQSAPVAPQEAADASVPEEPAAAPTAPGQTAPAWSGVDLDRSASRYLTSVTLELPQEKAGAELLELTGAVRMAGSKPIRVSAGNSTAMVGGELKTLPLSATGTYDLLRFELLQVNRQGPVDGVEYSEFVRLVNEISDKLDVLANLPDMNVVLIRSRVLDAEVASLDAQVAVNVETEQAIDPEQFAAFAAEQGMRAESDNKFLNVGEDGWTINSVELDQTGNRIVMILDVPTIPREMQPIRRMVECAWKFAQAYDGKMIDDSGRLIDNPLFERIESQLDIHYQALLAAGVPAGSDLARQVYNSD